MTSVSTAANGSRSGTDLSFVLTLPRALLAGTETDILIRTSLNNATCSRCSLLTPTASLLHFGSLPGFPPLGGILYSKALIPYKTLWSSSSTSAVHTGLPLTRVYCLLMSWFSLRFFPTLLAPTSSCMPTLSILFIQACLKDDARSLDLQYLYLVKIQQFFLLKATSKHLLLFSHQFLCILLPRCIFLTVLISLQDFPIKLVYFSASDHQFLHVLLFPLS